MRLVRFEYFEPRTLEEVISLLDRHKGEIELLAGGTDQLVLMKQRLISPKYLINLKRVAELDYIKHDGEALRIGALTTLETINRSSIIRGRCDILAQASGKVASLTIRNIGSIGGNICQHFRCWYYNQSQDWRKLWPSCYRLGGRICHANKESKQCQAVYLSDTAPALIALRAKVKLVGKDGERVVLLENFFKRLGTTLRSNEVLTEIQIPDQVKQTRGVYLKFSSRKAVDYPVVGVAVVMTIGSNDPAGRDIRVVAGAVGPTPIIVEDVESLSRGKEVDSELISQIGQTVRSGVTKQAVSFGDYSRDYKVGIAAILSKQAIEDCVRSIGAC